MARALVLLLLAFAAGSAAAQSPAAKMRASMQRVLAALPEKSRAQAIRPFEDRDRIDWHYTPRSRNGVSFKEMDKPARDAVHELLRTALSSVGYRKVVNIIELEIVLRELETFGWMRDPERYHLTVYGVPDRAQRWGWRFEGHHLSLNFTLAGDKLAVDTPSFFGANPATVASGPRKGLRALGEEHDAGWALLESLGEAQRREAVFEARTYGDIVTANRDKVEPLAAAGIAGAKLDEKQRAQLRARPRAGAPRAREERRHRGGPLRLGGFHRARQAALLPRAGTAISHRVRRVAKRR